MEKLPQAMPIGAADGSPSLRAQILATEHWSLLAARSTTQSEVLSRIAIFLTLVSAGLVSLALIGQATRFSSVFPTVGIVVLSFIVLVGVLTQVRVFNVGMEDLMYVLAMNRIRGAYLELDPGIAPVLMASAVDDEAGVRQTYYFLGSRGASQVLGSSVVFTIAVNSALIGVLVAAIASAAAVDFGTAVTMGVIAGVIFLGTSLWFGGRSYFAFWKSYRPSYPRAE